MHDVCSPLHPNISIHILHTVLYTFPYVLARRICLIIKRFFSWLSFPSFSWPQWLIQGWHWKKKVDASHTQGFNSVHDCTHFICSLHLLTTVVMAVRKANKQMNRRQWNEGSCTLHHTIEKNFTEYLKRETWIVIAKFLLMRFMFLIK